MHGQQRVRKKLCFTWRAQWLGFTDGVLTQLQRGSCGSRSHLSPQKKLFFGFILFSKIMLRSLNKSVAVLGRRAVSGRLLSTATKVVDTAPVIPVISVSTKVHEDLPGKYTSRVLEAAQFEFNSLKRHCAPILSSVSFQDVTLASYRIQSGLKKTVETISWLAPM